MGKQEKRVEFAPEGVDKVGNTGIGTNTPMNSFPSGIYNLSPRWVRVSSGGTTKFLTLSKILDTDLICITE